MFGSCLHRLFKRIDRSQALQAHDMMSLLACISSPQHYYGLLPLCDRQTVLQSGPLICSASIDKYTVLTASVEAAAALLTPAHFLFCQLKTADMLMTLESSLTTKCACRSSCSQCLGRCLLFSMHLWSNRHRLASAAKATCWSAQHRRWTGPLNLGLGCCRSCFWL